MRNILQEGEIYKRWWIMVEMEGRGKYAEKTITNKGKLSSPTVITNPTVYIIGFALL